MRLRKVMKPVPEINMIPMIDVIMMLLIFFLVATQMKTQEVRADVQLPDSLQALLNRDIASPLVINILPRDASDKPYSIGPVKLDNRELLDVLRVQASFIVNAGAEMASVRIRADRSADFSQLQSALKACQLSHIKAVYIATEFPR